MKYLDPRYDLTFKKLFEQDELLISFLNALLPLQEGQKVESIQHLSPEMVPETPFNKYSIVDVRCKDNHGRHFIVEMQMYWNEAFKQRVLFNSAKAYVRQANEGYRYSKLQPVYSLNLINEKAFNSSPNYYHIFKMSELDNSENIIEGIEIVFVELPKFRSENESADRMKRLWMRFFTEINERTRTVDDELTSEPVISKALAVMERAAYSEPEMIAYDKLWDAVASERTLIEGSMAEGRKQGMEEGKRQGMEEGKRQGMEEGKRQGIEEGKRQGMEEGKRQGIEEGKRQGIEQNKVETAKRMCEEGIDINTISKITGLDVELLNTHLRK